MLSVCITSADGSRLVVKEQIEEEGSPFHTAISVLETFLDGVAPDISQNTTKTYKVHFTVPQHLPCLMIVEVLFKNQLCQRTCEGVVFEEEIMPYTYKTGVPSHVQWKDSPFKQP